MFLLPTLISILNAVPPSPQPLTATSPRRLKHKNIYFRALKIGGGGGMDTYIGYLCIFEVWGVGLFISKVSILLLRLGIV